MNNITLNLTHSVVAVCLALVPWLHAQTPLPDSSLPSQVREQTNRSNSEKAAESEQTLKAIQAVKTQSDTRLTELGDKLRDAEAALRVQQTKLAELQSRIENGTKVSADQVLAELNKHVEAEAKASKAAGEAQASIYRELIDSRVKTELLVLKQAQDAVATLRAAMLNERSQFESSKALLTLPSPVLDSDFKYAIARLDTKLKEKKSSPIAALLKSAIDTAFPSATWLTTATNLFFTSGFKEDDQERLFAPLACALEFATLAEKEKAVRTADADQLVTRINSHVAALAQLASDVEDLVLPLPASEDKKSAKGNDFRVNVDLYQTALLTKPADRPADVQLELSNRLNPTRRILARVREQINVYEAVMASSIAWHERLPEIVGLHKSFKCSIDNRTRTSDATGNDAALKRAIDDKREARVQQRISLRVISESI